MKPKNMVMPVGFVNEVVKLVALWEFGKLSRNPEIDGIFWNLKHMLDEKAERVLAREEWSRYPREMVDKE